MVLRDEDGTIASREFTIDVTGADGAPTTFNVSSDEELKALAGKTISGDTIVIANGTTVNRLDASEYPGVTFSVASGTVRFVVDVNYPLDAQNLAVAAGASVVFEAVAAKPYFGHYNLVQMPATMAGEWSVETPFYLSSAAAVDADNILGFDALGGKDPDYGTMTVLFPDGPDVRTHELTAFESYGGLVYSDESAVDGVSVLGSTLTLKGENTFAGAISQEEGNTTIALAEGATLDVGSYVYTLGGSLALSAGSTFKFGAPASGTVVENAALGGTIVPPASGKANLELTTALADGTSVTVFDYYTGSAESFTLVVPGDVDATHYTLVCEDGHLVVKCAQPVHEGDAGTMTTSGSDSITVAQGARPNSTMVTVSGGTAPYEWSCPAATYATTRETATFDGTSGTTELSFRQRLGDLYDRNLVDLGFDFPFAGTLSREVLVNLNGSISIRRSGISNIGKICLLGSDCPNFATANDIYVSRAEGSATIRFGRRVAVTLSADGKIRVAYGPLAEGAEKRYMPVDVIVMLYAAYDPVTAAQIEERVARFEAENGEYNGINDVVFTPTGAIPYGLHPEFNGATAKVCGTIGTVCASAGAYPVTFRCVDANGYVIEKVVTVNVTGSSSMPSATASPSLMADGVCHITYGDSQTFTVSGLSGVSAENCSWYEDDVLTRNTCSPAR